MRVHVLITLSLTAALSAQTTTTPERAKYVAPDFGMAYTMTARSPVAGQPKPVSLGVLIPVTPEKDVRFEELSAKVTAVAPATGFDSALLGAFKAAAQVPQGATPQIEITTEGVPLRPGVYTLTIEIAPDPAKKAPPAEGKTNQAPPPPANLPQRMTLQLTIPAATINPLTAQTIDRVLYCFWRCPDAAAPTLRVMETSNRIGLSGVEAIQNDKLVAADGTSVTATIRSTKPVPVAAGHVGSIPLIIDNESNLPLGKSTTTVAVTANELAAPVIAPFEIRVRLDPWLLLPAIAFGFLLGFVLRVLLKRFIDRGAAQASGYDLIEKIKALQQREIDPVFFKATATARTTVVEAFDGDAAAMTSAIASAAAAVQAAGIDLQARLEALAAAINETRQITKSTNFPDEIAAAVAAADSDLAGVETLLTARNASGGTAALAELKGRLAARVAEAAASWRTEVRTALAEIESLPKLPRPWATSLTGAAKTLGTSLDGILDDMQHAELILDGVNTARFQAIHDVAGGAIEPVAEYADRVAEEIENIPAVADPVRSASTALRQAIDNDRSTTLRQPIAALRALLTAMRTTTLNATPAEHRQEIETMLDAGEYEEAAKATAAGGTAVEEAIIQGAVPPLPPESATPEPWRATLAVSAAAPQVDAALAGARTMLRWELAIARALSSFGIGILLALGGFAFLYPGFDGTLRGLLTAFFWGYASDFSAEAITQAAKQK